MQTSSERRPSLAPQHGGHCGLCHGSKAPRRPPGLLAGFLKAALHTWAQWPCWWVLPGLLGEPLQSVVTRGGEGNMLREGEVFQVAVAMGKYALLILVFLVYICIYFWLWTEKGDVWSPPAPNLMQSPAAFWRHWRIWGCILTALAFSKPGAWWGGRLLGHREA